MRAALAGSRAGDADVHDVGAFGAFDLDLPLQRVECAQGRVGRARGAETERPQQSAKAPCWADKFRIVVEPFRADHAA